MNDWYGFTKNDTERIAPSQVYEFTEGMIRMYGDNIGYLMTNASYENFELSLEFRWNMDEKYKRDTGKKNSGVMYNIPSDAPDHIWPQGIQFQIKENSTGDFVFLDNIKAKVNGIFIDAGASVVSPKFDSNENPYGQWNKILILSYNGKCTQYLNGKLVNECIEASSNEGKISLNYEGSPIDFKNIKLNYIRKL
ncbi:DUF1080 domain-containing protein [Flavobacterium sp. WC2421]|uniref:3-keto-disaccharide hydrolase n=1 Tax=Flavobacterium sp. WC2421 TaxID=3234138 RepID=UPI0034651733